MTGQHKTSKCLIFIVFQRKIKIIRKVKKGVRESFKDNKTTCE